MSLKGQLYYSDWIETHKPMIDVKIWFVSPQSIDVNRCFKDF